jgi:hypothetical protein
MLFTLLGLTPPFTLRPNSCLDHLHETDPDAKHSDYRPIREALGRSIECCTCRMARLNQEPKKRPTTGDGCLSLVRATTAGNRQTRSRCVGCTRVAWPGLVRRRRAGSRVPPVR